MSKLSNPEKWQRKLLDKNVTKRFWCLYEKYKLTGHSAGIWHPPHSQLESGCFPGLYEETQPAAAAELSHLPPSYWASRPPNHPHPYLLGCSYIPQPREQQDKDFRFFFLIQQHLAKTQIISFHLEPAKRVLQSKIHWLVIVAVVALSCTPVGLQLVPLGKNGVPFIP